MRLRKNTGEFVANFQKSWSENSEHRHGFFNRNTSIACSRRALSSALAKLHQTGEEYGSLVMTNETSVTVVEARQISGGSVEEEAQL